MDNVLWAYRHTPTLTLRRLREAFVLELTEEGDEGHHGFCRGRIALIDKVLEERRCSAQ